MVLRRKCPLLHSKFKVDYRVIPWVTFCDPEIARVGLNEKEAKKQKFLMS